MLYCLGFILFCTIPFNIALHLILKYDIRKSLWLIRGNKNDEHYKELKEAFVSTLISFICGISFGIYLYLTIARCF